MIKNHNQTRKLFSIDTYDLKYGVKLCEHTDKDSQVVRLVTNLIYELNKQGWTTQLVWLGDYADPSFGEKNRPLWFTQIYQCTIP